MASKVRIERPEPRPGPVAEPEEETVGIECSGCGCRHFEVIRTIAVVKGIRRERACRYCGKRLFTVERAAGAQKHATGSGVSGENPQNLLTESEGVT